MLAMLTHASCVVCMHPLPWSLRSLVISVLGDFVPKDRTNLATSVLRKPKLSQGICKVFLRCMFIVLKRAVCCISYITQKSYRYWHFIMKKETHKEQH